MIHFIDHPELVLNHSPEFNALVPQMLKDNPRLIALPAEFGEALVKLLTELAESVKVINTIEDATERNTRAAKIDEIRQETFQQWAEFCMDIQSAAEVGYGGVSFKPEDSNYIFQLMKISITHPRREDLSMHAFSMAAFELTAIGEPELMGEDCGLQFTVHNEEPNPEDYELIRSKLQELDGAPTFDDYLSIF